MILSEFNDYIKNNKNIYIYGAGQWCKNSVLPYILLYGIKVDGIIVSKLEDNELTLQGISVYEAEQIKEPQNINVIVAIKNGKTLLQDIISDKKFRSVFYCQEELIPLLRSEIPFLKIESRLDGLAIQRDKVEFEPGHLQLVDKKNGVPICRIPQYLYSDEMLETLSICNTRVMTEQYGKMKYIDSVGEMGFQSDSEMYVVTSHFDKSSVDMTIPDGYIPVQVGAAMTDIRKGFICDDNGDNISYRNRDYCECTGLYWMWKNTDSQKYIGLSHYRRRLFVNDMTVNLMDKDNIDVVMAMPEFTGSNIKDFICKFVKADDWELFENAVSEVNDDYAKVLQKLSKSHFFFPCNIFFMRRELFNSYCEFAFSVSDKIYAYYEKQQIIRQDRYMGYLFEIMLSLFIMANKDSIKCAYTDVKWVDR